jgi:endonuclease/exonuclease/phosphatase family metal-dependent hydrolase
MKSILKYLFGIIGIIALVLAFIIIYAVISDYKPDTTTLVFNSETPSTLVDTNEYNLMIWNIGYCGLSKEMDFFYDGGKMVRPTQESVLKNIDAVNAFLAQNDTIDFYLIQEIDKKSKRSYKIDQFEIVENQLEGYDGYYGKNYDVFFVPIPPTSPMGKVDAGLATYSKFVPETSVRHSFPGNYAFPKGLFMLDRCFLVNRYILSNGKDLLIINTHNSAYDDGSLRKGQMDYLKSFLTSEYEKGNYIIVGGDWNQSPFALNHTYDNPFDKVDNSVIDENYLPKDWTWNFDNSIPTNRRVTTPFIKETSLTTIIDFYLFSPNIEAITTKTVNLNFENSDHQPVLAKIKLK